MAISKRFIVCSQKLQGSISCQGPVTYYSGRVDRASATEAVNLGLISVWVKPKVI